MREVELGLIDAKIKYLRDQLRAVEAEKQNLLSRKPGVDIILGDAGWTPAQREEAMRKYFNSLSPEALAKWKIYENPKPKQRVS